MKKYDSPFCKGCGEYLGFFRNIDHEIQEIEIKIVEKGETRKTKGYICRKIQNKKP